MTGSMMGSTTGRARRPRRTPAPIALLVLLALAAAPAPARATWSIVAVDRATREVGVAGASCYPRTWVIAQVVPGHGAIAAQSIANLDGRERAAARLREGARPDAILAELRTRRFDGWHLPLHRVRQYGIASLDAPAASYTGKWTMPWSGAAQGDGVAVQGNLLRGPEVVAATLATFETSARTGCGAPPAMASETEMPAPCCSLGERLLRALEAGAAAGGDRRCPIEQTALSAVLLVARPGDPDDAPTLRVVAPEQEKGGANPVALLRREYDRWRALHPEPGC